MVLFSCVSWGCGLVFSNVLLGACWTSVGCWVVCSVGSSRAVLLCWEARVIPPASVRMLPIPASAAMIIFFFGFVSGVLFVG